MDAKEALDLFEMSAMIPNLESSSTSSELYLCMRLSVGHHQQQYVRMWMAYVCQSRYCSESLYADE
jgi:hypothetical protein